MMAKKIESSWAPDRRLMVTQISGEINVADVKRWRESLQYALDQIPNNTPFKILVNMYGSCPVDINAHIQLNTTVPQLLSQYGWKVGSIDMFEDQANAMSYTRKRGVYCYGAAHCHHDIFKMELCEIYYSSNNEHYFTDPGYAEQWISAIGPFPANNHPCYNSSILPQQLYT